MALEANIRALLHEQGLGFKQNSKSFILGCPRCGKSQKLYILKSDGRFVCWVCKETDNFYGRCEYAFLELCQLPLTEIRKALYGHEESRPAQLYLDINFGDFAEEEEYVELEPALKEMAWPLDFYPLDHELGTKGLRYLESRGIPPSVALEYGCRYCPGQQRVIFPVESRGHLYGWQARLVCNDKPYWDEKRGETVTPIKAVTSLDLKKERCLMFADRLQDGGHCILTEGPLDALKCHMAGGNVASMGKAVSARQLTLIRNAGVERLYLGLDPDAYLEINRLRRELQDLLLFDLRAPHPYGDLGEMPMETVAELFRQAPRLQTQDIVVYLESHFGVP